MTPAKRKRDSIIPEKNDVLLGRGGINSKNTGNDLLRRLALEATEQYRTAQKKQKYDITLEILKKMNSLQPRGRFLRFSLKTFTWCEISQKDAREKVSQSIRDALKKLTQVDPRLPRAPQKPHMSSTVLKKCIVTKYPKHCRTYPDPPRKDDQSLSTNILDTSSELSHRNSRLRILYKSNSSDKFKSAELVKDTSNAICFDGLQSINLPKIPKRIKKIRRKITQMIPSILYLVT